MDRFEMLMDLCQQDARKKLNEHETEVHTDLAEPDRMADLRQDQHLEQAVDEPLVSETHEAQGESQQSMDSQQFRPELWGFDPFEGHTDVPSSEVHGQLHQDNHQRHTHQRQPWVWQRGFGTHSNPNASDREAGDQEPQAGTRLDQLDPRFHCGSVSFGSNRHIGMTSDLTRRLLNQSLRDLEANTMETNRSNDAYELMVDHLEGVPCWSSDLKKLLKMHSWEAEPALRSFQLLQKEHVRGCNAILADHSLRIELPFLLTFEDIPIPALDDADLQKRCAILFLYNVVKNRFKARGSKYQVSIVAVALTLAHARWVFDSALQTWNNIAHVNALMSNLDRLQDSPDDYRALDKRLALLITWTQRLD